MKEYIYDKNSQLFLDLITNYLLKNYDFLENYKITYSLKNEIIGTISALEYVKNFHSNGNSRITYDIKIKRKIK